MPKDEPHIPAVTESEITFQGMIWDVVSETFDFNHESLTRQYVNHPGAVAVVAVNSENEVLLIKQYRHPVRSYLWEIPAGLLDVPGEAEIDAAKRELLEETGYVAEQWSELIEFYTTPGGNSERIKVFFAQKISFVGRPENQEGEEANLQLDWVPLEDAVSAVLRSDIKSPSAAVGLMALALRKK